MLVLTALSMLGVRACNFEGKRLCELLETQERKIAALPPATGTIFIGDSSLGNAVDAAMFTELAGGPESYNVALTAFSFGLPSTYAVLQEVLAKTRPREVVIMFSPEAYRRKPKVSAQGFIYTSQAENVLASAFELGGNFGRSVLKTYTQLVFDRRSLESGIDHVLGRQPEESCANCIETDYMRQRKPLAPDKVKIRRWKGPYKTYQPILAGIADLCQRAEVRCSYVHGPTLDVVLNKQKASYLETVNRFVVESGLELVDEAPLAFPLAELGDRINHIRADLKPKYTGIVADLLMQRGEGGD